MTYSSTSLIIKKFAAFMIAIQVGIMLTGLSIAIGNKVGFGHFWLTPELAATYTDYDEFMDAWKQSIVWQFFAYMALLWVPKYFIYRDKTKKFFYSLVIYWMLPIGVWFLIEKELFRFTAFTVIAAVAFFEGILYYSTHQMDQSVPKKR